MKVVKRHVIIRQYDYYQHLLPKAKKLYTGYKFVPFTKTSLEEEWFWTVLRGTTPGTLYSHIGYLYFLLEGGKTDVYDFRYKKWEINPLDNGLIEIKPNRANIKSSILGRAYLEYDYSKI